MQLKPLVVALQGIGFGPVAVALQGLVDVQGPTPIDPQRVPYSDAGAGGPGSQITRRQMLAALRRRRERKAFAAGVFS